MLGLKQCIGKLIASSDTVERIENIFLLKRFSGIFFTSQKYIASIIFYHINAISSSFFGIFFAIICSIAGVKCTCDEKFLKKCKKISKKCLLFDCFMLYLTLRVCVREHGVVDKALPQAAFFVLCTAVGLRFKRSSHTLRLVDGQLFRHLFLKGGNKP